MKTARVGALLWLSFASSALAAETTTLPKGAFLLDVGYLNSQINKEWDGNRRGRSLIDDIYRYEPGGGLQGIISAKPTATFHVMLFQLLYGITDDLTVGIYMPLVLRTDIDANLTWTPGDYQSALGRSYSEDDFWEWAESLGQPRLETKRTSNRGQLADIVLAARYNLPKFFLTETLGLRIAPTLQVALPTGTGPEPEELLTAGTSSFELHTYGDVEIHLPFDRQFFVDGYGVPRLNIGGDIFYSWFRPKSYPTSKGTRNPLLQTYAPYVGETYTIDPGDWFGATISIEGSPWAGPTFGTWMTKGDREKALAFPPLLTLGASYTYIATGQSDWQSNSPLWDYDREKHWLPGDKNVFRFTATFSLLRLGAPLQLYVGYRAQDFIPGRYTRPANVITAGMRVLAKFW